MELTFDKISLAQPSKRVATVLLAQPSFKKGQFKKDENELWRLQPKKDDELFIDETLIKAEAEKADLIVFPELSIPVSCHCKLEEWTRKNQNVLLIAGSDYIDRYNTATIFFNGERYSTEKFYLSKHEAASFYNKGADCRLGKQHYFVTPVGTLGILICSDLFGDRNYAISNKILNLNLDILCVIAFQNKTDDHYQKINQWVKESGDGIYVIYSNVLCPPAADGGSAVFSYESDKVHQEYIDWGFNESDVYDCKQIELPKPACCLVFKCFLPAIDYTPGKPAEKPSAVNEMKLFSLSKEGKFIDMANDDGKISRPSSKKTRKTVEYLHPLPHGNISREDVLEEIEKHFAVKQCVGLYGRPGSGKTVVALQYMHRKKASTAVVFIDGRTDLSIYSSFFEQMSPDYRKELRNDDSEKLESAKMILSSLKTLTYFFIDNATEAGKKIIHKIFSHPHQFVKTLITSQKAVREHAYCADINMQDYYEEKSGIDFLVQLLREHTTYQGDELFAKKIVEKSQNPIIVIAHAQNIEHRHISFRKYYKDYLLNADFDYFNEYFEQYKYDDKSAGAAFKMYFDDICGDNTSYVKMMFVISGYRDGVFKRTWITERFEKYGFTKIDETERFFGELIERDFVCSADKQREKYKINEMTSSLFRIYCKSFDFYTQLQNIEIEIIENLFNYDYHTFSSQIENQELLPHATFIAGANEKVLTETYCQLQSKLTYYNRAVFLNKQAKRHNDICFEILNENNFEINNYLGFSCFACRAVICGDNGDYAGCEKYLNAAEQEIRRLQVKGVLTDEYGISGNMRENTKIIDTEFHSGRIEYLRAKLMLHKGDIDKAIESIEKSIAIDNKLGISPDNNNSQAERYYHRQACRLVILIIKKSKSKAANDTVSLLKELIKITDVVNKRFTLKSGIAGAMMEYFQVLCVSLRKCGSCAELLEHIKRYLETEIDISKAPGAYKRKFLSVLNELEAM